MQMGTLSGLMKIGQEYASAIKVSLISLALTANNMSDGTKILLSKCEKKIC